MNNYEDQKKRYSDLKNLATDTKEALEKIENLLKGEFYSRLNFIGLDEDMAMDGLQGLDHAKVMLDRIKKAVEKNQD